MEVLACIPELSGPAASAAAPLPFSRPSEVVAPPMATPEPSVTVDSGDSEDVDDADTSDDVSPAPRRGMARRLRPSRLFSPSIVVLAVVAAVVWTAAWRNDQLRLEAARQQRPERLAQELPATAGAARSVTP